MSENLDLVRSIFSAWALAYTACGERVLVDIMLHARRRIGQVAISRPEWHVWTVRGRKAVRVQWFKDEAVARSHAGLGAEG